MHWISLKKSRSLRSETTGRPKDSYAARDSSVAPSPTPWKSSIVGIGVMTISG